MCQTHTHRYIHTYIQIFTCLGRLCGARSCSPQLDVSTTCIPYYSIMTFTLCYEAYRIKRMNIKRYVNYFLTTAIKLSRCVQLPYSRDKRRTTILIACFYNKCLLAVVRRLTNLKAHVILKRSFTALWGHELLFYPHRSPVMVEQSVS